MKILTYVCSSFFAPALPNMAVHGAFPDKATVACCETFLHTSDDLLFFAILISIHPFVKPKGIYNV